MLKFFRQIRQKLIRENRFSTYLLYAVGEIVLVVIGILIALQINNWNNERIDRSESNEIKKALLNDLRKDSLMLQEYISMLERTKLQTSNLFERWNHESANYDTLVKIVQEFNPTYDNITSFNDHTYQSILSSGKLALLNTELQSKLLEVNSWQAISLDDINSRQYLEFINEYTIRYPLGTPNKGYVSKLVWEFPDRRDFAMKFSTMCWFKNFLLGEFQRRYSNTLEVTNELITELDTNF